MALRVLQKKSAYPSTTLTLDRPACPGSLLVVFAAGFTGTGTTISISGGDNLWERLVYTGDRTTSSTAIMWWATCRTGGIFTITFSGTLSDTGLHFYEVDLPGPHALASPPLSIYAEESTPSSRKVLSSGTDGVTLALIHDAIEAGTVGTWRDASDSMIQNSHWSLSGVWLSLPPSGRVISVNSWSGTNPQYAIAAATFITQKPTRLLKSPILQSITSASIYGLFPVSKKRGRQPQAATDVSSRFGQIDLAYIPALESRYQWTVSGNKTESIYGVSHLVTSPTESPTSPRVTPAGAVSVLAVVKFNSLNQATFGGDLGATIFTQREVNTDVSPTFCVSNGGAANGSAGNFKLWFGCDAAGTAVGKSNPTLIQTGVWYVVAAAADANGVTGVAVNGFVGGDVGNPAGTWSSNWTGGPSRLGRHTMWGGGAPNVEIALFARFRRTLSNAELSTLTSGVNAPWQVFKPYKQVLPIAITGISRPSRDELTTGWSASQSGFTLYDMVDEVSVNDSDYIISANTTAPVLLGWDYPLGPGVYNVSVRAERTGTTGDFRVILEDSLGTPAYTSNWQTLTQDLTTYIVTVNLLVTATRIRIETRASV